MNLTSSSCSLVLPSARFIFLFVSWTSSWSFSISLWTESRSLMIKEYSWKKWRKHLKFNSYFRTFKLLNRYLILWFKSRQIVRIEIFIFKTNRNNRQFQFCFGIFVFNTCTTYELFNRLYFFRHSIVHRVYWKNWS